MRDNDGEEVVSKFEIKEVVISHPSYWNLLVLIGLFYPVVCVIAAFLPGRHGQPPTIAGQIFFLTVGAGTLVAILQTVLWTCRSRIVVDQEGIRWRGAWQGWRSARWEEVTDYWTTVNHWNARSGKQIGVCEVVIPQGVLKFYTDWSGAEALRRAIPQHASHAKASGWELLGTRRVDTWPRTFIYWKPEWRLQAILVSLGAVVMMALVIAASHQFLKAVEHLFDPAEMKRITYPIYGATLVLLAIPGMPLTRYLRGWQRRGEKFTVTPDTLQYVDTSRNETIQVTWSEVSDYFYKTNSRDSTGIYTFVLRGAEEKQISWASRLLDSSLLLAIVQRYAPRPANSTEDIEGWREWSAAEKTGGSDPRTWQGGAVGIGGRTFSYRDLPFGILLTVLTVCAVFFGVMLTLSLRRGDHDAWIGGIMVSLIGLPTLGGWCRFLFSRVETDDMGITQYTLLGKKYLYWYLIEDYKENMLPKSQRRDPVWNLLVTGRKGIHLTIWPDINGYRELKREITRYAPSPKTGWKQTTETVARVNGETAARPVDSANTLAKTTEERETVTTISLRNDR